MARIRSIHPGLFTDETFVSVSPLARILYFGILTEADDFGAFEWKPITLKMRILGADNADVSALLEELQNADRIKRYEHDGRQFGLVRNFCKYQRPKKPKSVYFIPPEFGTYIALNARSSEPDDDKEDAVPQKSEISPQMEDGGGRMKDGKSSLRSDYPFAFEEIWAALPKRSGSNDKKQAFRAWKARKAEGHTDEAMLAGACRYAAWCRATGKEHTETVKQGVTFLGPADPPHFTLDWALPDAAKVSGQQSSINLDAIFGPKEAAHGH